MFFFLNGFRIRSAIRISPAALEYNPADCNCLPAVCPEAECAIHELNRDPKIGCDLVLQC